VVKAQVKRICFVVSTLLTVRAFLLDQIAALGENNAVVVAANATDPEELQRLGVDVPVIFVPIERKVSPLRDLWALIRLLIFFRQQHFDVVHSLIPKVGVLAMTAAYLARVPIRIHTFTGQTWATRKGAVRALLRAIDRLTAGLATNTLVDSHSQRKFLIENGVVSAARSSVLANGSVCGVDGERFRPDEAARTRVRSDLGVPNDAVLFLYLGRLRREKGLLDLAEAFAAIVEHHAQAQMLFVGPDEDKLRHSMDELLSRCASQVHWVDYTDIPEAYLAAADVFCLPSYREGFGQVLIEASAVGIPVIATRIYGVTDAVIEGETGLLYRPGDVAALREHMKTLASAPTLRRQLGSAGRIRALREFARAQVTRAMVEYYASLTAKL